MKSRLPFATLGQSNLCRTFVERRTRMVLGSPFLPVFLDGAGLFLQSFLASEPHVRFRMRTAPRREIQHPKAEDLIHFRDHVRSTTIISIPRSDYIPMPFHCFKAIAILLGGSEGNCLGGRRQPSEWDKMSTSRVETFVC